MNRHIEHPLIKPDAVEQRLYQLNLAGSALAASTLVVLPTGLGKTIIALLAMASRLEKFGGKVLMLSPTKPLVEQHASFFRNVLSIPEDEILTFTGGLPPKQREALWQKGKVIVSTPQVIENDLLAKRIDLLDVSHITFDEAHRAVGSYAYTYIAERYFETARNPLALGITASPGSSDEKINEVCQALHVGSVVVKTESDSDVKPYVHKKDIEWEHLKLPSEMKSLKELLEKIMEDRFNKLTELGYPVANRRSVTKKDLLSLQRRLQGQMRGVANPEVYSAISILAEIMKVNHAVEVVETQGIMALTKYIDKLENEACSSSGSKASKRLSQDLYMRQLIHRLRECGSEHPKIAKVRHIVSQQLVQNPDSRVIVFTNYRDTAEMVSNSLEDVEGVRPVRFVGQGSRYKDKGLTQKQQIKIIQDFKDGQYNVLVATSVAEEGLDIPATDLVLFYEPVPSEIRSIQRKGRTGRKHEGRVVVLVTKGTRDEGYYWSSIHKERRMQANMQQLQESMPAAVSDELHKDSNCSKDQKTLTDFDSDSLKVVVDHRETRSTVARSLERLGMDLEVKTLEVGDYLVSDRMAIERKSGEDLVGSLLDRKLFEQISNLSRSYEKGALIVEGEGLFTARRIDPNAIHGALLSISMDFGISIFHTRDAEDTASVIRLMAKKEQSDEKREVSMHGKKASMMLSQQQEYIISSIPEIGPKAAHNLLDHFGSVENVMKATHDQLLEVDLIGPKTASRIREVVESEYKG